MYFQNTSEYTLILQRHRLAKVRLARRAIDRPHLSTAPSVPCAGHSYCRYVINWQGQDVAYSHPQLCFSPFSPVLFPSSVCPTAMRLSLPMSSLVTFAVATNLYVSSYIGTITSLRLTERSNGSYSLRQVAVNKGSEPNPSWLTKDHYNNFIYCADEGLTVPNGSLASYKTSHSGKLTQIDRHSSISGPVSSTVYNGGQALAVAH